jgi:cytochrome c oxidase subunit II
VRYWSLLFGLVGLLCVASFVYAPFDSEWWLPAGPDPKVSHLHSVSTVGKEIDALFVIILWITGVVFVGTHVALVWAAWKFADGPGRIAVYFHGSQRLELIWTIIPAIALVFITVYQFGTWANVKYKGAAPKAPALAEVTGRQFQWMIRYAGPDRMMHTADDVHAINDLHFVKNQPTLIQLQAKDVLHSFFLPQLRIKQDAVPGLKIPVWFDADQAGRYDLACAELCGWGHYKMRGNVTVHETQAEFDDWMRAAAREQSRDQVALAVGPEGR